MVIGALGGLLVSLATKCGQQGIIKDAFLGSFGFLVGFLGCVSMPWPRNTIVEQLEGGGTVTNDLNIYQHPYRVALWWPFFCRSCMTVSIEASAHKLT